MLGIAGELLSGKSTAAAFYIEKFGAKHLKFSRLLDEVLSLLNLPFSRQNEQDLGALLKNLFGQEVLTNALANIAKTSGHEIVLFDGIRRVEEAQALKRELPNFKLIYISAGPQIRYDRLLQRREKADEGRPMSLADFLATQEHAADKAITDTKQYADYVIYNDDSIESFEAQLTRVVAQEAM